jgi:hypothetical protein
MLKSRRSEIDEEFVALEGAPSVAAAVREMRTHHSVSVVRTGLETALTIVRNVLTQPKDIRMYRIKRGNPVFHRTLGCLHGCELLMHAIGFSGGEREESALAKLSDLLASSDGAEMARDVVSSLGSAATKTKAAVFILKSVSKTGFDPNKSGNLPRSPGN